MKKWIFPVLISLPVIYFAACSKASNGYQTPVCTSVSVNSDSAALLKFAGDSIQAVRDTTGLYYQILDTGTGGVPSPTSYLKVSYVAKLMDNSTFDTATNAVLQVQLYQLIAGWQIGLPKIREGGHIRLLIPSAFAYGCQGATNGQVVVVPPNAPVYFDIRLISTTN